MVKDTTYMCGTFQKGIFQMNSMKKTVHKMDLKFKKKLSFWDFWPI